MIYRSLWTRRGIVAVDSQVSSSHDAFTCKFGQVNASCKCRLIWFQRELSGKMRNVRPRSWPEDVSAWPIPENVPFIYQHVSPRQSRLLWEKTLRLQKCGWRAGIRVLGLRFVVDLIETFHSIVTMQNPVALCHTMTLWGRTWRVPQSSSRQGVRRGRPTPKTYLYFRCVIVKFKPYVVGRGSKIWPLAVTTSPSAQNVIKI